MLSQIGCTQILTLSQTIQAFKFDFDSVWNNNVQNNVQKGNFVSEMEHPPHTHTHTHTHTHNYEVA